MDDMIDNLMKKEFISVWVRDPREHKEDFWHTHVDYEICLHTNSMCFGKKTSCVRRRYKEFVWLRHRLQDNDQLIELPKLPPWNPFFSLSNTYQLTQRMKGLQHFLEIVLKIPSLLSDSRLHLFLQSQLNTVKMDACAQGLTRYSVSQAIQHCDVPRFPFDEESKTYSDSDCESSISSSGLGHSVESSARGEETPSHNPSHNPSHSFVTTPTGSELLNCMSLSRSPGNEQDVYS